MHFAFDGEELFQDLFEISEKTLVTQARRNVRDRSAQIGWKQVENFLRGRREPMNAQLAIEKNRADIGRGHQVVEIGVRPAQLFHAALSS